MTDAQTEARAIAQKLQDVVDGTDGWLNVDKAIDIIAPALAAKDAELAVQREAKEHARRLCDRAEAQLAEARAERDRWEKHATTGDGVLGRTLEKLRAAEAERDRLAADNARLEAENATLRMHAEARAILAGKE